MGIDEFVLDGQETSIEWYWKDLADPRYYKCLTGPACTESLMNYEVVRALIPRIK